MGALEDDLSRFPPRYVEQPRKVHLFHDQKGAEYGSMGKRHKYANTLCKGNFAGPDLQTTNDQNLVTCKICRRDARFKAYTGHPKSAVEISAPAPTPSKPALRTRYRVGWRGRLILQVEELYNNADDRDPLDLGQTFMRWRDAKLSDLGLGVV